MVKFKPLYSHDFDQPISEVLPSHFLAILRKFQRRLFRTEDLGRIHLYHANHLHYNRQHHQKQYT